MTTAATKVLSQSLQFRRETPVEAFFPSQNPDGTTLDVSTGYTARLKNISVPSAFGAGVTTDSGNTITLTTTGVNIAWPASGLAAYDRTLYNYVVEISDDSFTTKSQISHGSIQVAAGPSDSLSSLN